MTTTSKSVFMTLPPEQSRPRRSAFREMRQRTRSCRFSHLKYQTAEMSLIRSFTHPCARPRCFKVGQKFLMFSSSFSCALGPGSATSTLCPWARKRAVQEAPITPVPTTPMVLIDDMAMIVQQRGWVVDRCRGSCTDLSMHQFTLKLPYTYVRKSTKMRRQQFFVYGSVAISSVMRPQRAMLRSEL